MTNLGVQFSALVNDFWNSYTTVTPRKLQLIDLFLVYTIVTGIILAVYTLVSGMYPFNSFIASFINCVGFFILTVCLRLQIANPKDFGMISAEQSFASYVICNLLLFFVVFTYIG